MKLAPIIYWVLQTYVALIVLQIIGSWVEGVRDSAVMRFIDKLTWPYLRLFGFIPPMAGFDLAPVIGVVILQSLARWVFKQPF